jgi:hypothetical protein
MHVVLGIYHWFSRRVAFRNDFCLACAAPTRAVQISTSDVLHLYWVPVLPIGRWKRWYCTKCGNQPHHNVKTRRVFKIAGLLLLLFFATIAWMPRVVAHETVAWIVRVVAPLGAVATAIHIARSSPDDPSYNARQLEIVPADDTICPFCDTPLVSAPPHCYCPICQVNRL